MENAFFLIFSITMIAFLLLGVWEFTGKVLDKYMFKTYPVELETHAFDSATCCQHAEGLFDECYCSWCSGPEFECQTCIERNK